MANFELPTLPETGAEKNEKGQERTKTAAESSPSTKPAQAALPTLQPQAPTQIPVITDQDQPAQKPVPVSDAMAKEGHIIEKEWINRAKKIISETKDDPHKQKTEISKVKAEYIKKRFNKTIPADDPVAT